jgi:hypothetical protein
VTVVAYKKMIVYYKIIAPTSERIEIWEKDLVTGGGHNLVHTLNLGRRQDRTNVKVEGPQWVFFEGADPDRFVELNEDSED